MSRSATTRRQAAYRRGLYAETVAAAYLRLKGFTILARRYRAPVGEIDLVARRGALFVFVEVKARNEGGDIVSLRQRQRIRRAAEAWLARQQTRNALPAGFDARFDVVTVLPWRLPQHLPAAFDG